LPRTESHASISSLRLKSMMLGRAIQIGLLLAACQGCTVVSCPASLSCALKTNTGAQGGGSSAGEDGGAGGSPEDASDAGSVFPAGQWVSVIGNLKGKPSFCGNLSGVWQWPGQDVLVAGVAGQGLFSEAADGTDWVQLGSAKGSEPINHAPETVLFDPDNSDHFWECGIHGTGDGAYATTDGGKTFTKINVVPQADTIAVDFSNAQRKVLFTTGHENNQAVQRSTDGANTWSSIGATLPDDRACTIFMLVDSTTYLVGCGVSGGLTGIYRTTDSGKGQQRRRRTAADSSERRLHILDDGRDRTIVAQHGPGADVGGNVPGEPATGGVTDRAPRRQARRVRPAELGDLLESRAAVGLPEPALSACRRDGRHVFDKPQGVLHLALGLPR
jgi:hypothetical protein